MRPRGIRQDGRAITSSPPSSSALEVSSLRTSFPVPRIRMYSSSAIDQEGTSPRRDHLGVADSRASAGGISLKKPSGMSAPERTRARYQDGDGPRVQRS